MLLFRSAVAYKPPLSSNFFPPPSSLPVCLSACHLYTLSALSVSLILCFNTKMQCMRLITEPHSSPSPSVIHTSLFSRFSYSACYLKPPSRRCKSASSLRHHVCAPPSCLSVFIFDLLAFRLPPQFLFLLLLFFLFFISAALRLCRPAVSSITRPSISSSIFLFFLCLPTRKHSRRLPPRLESTLSQGGEIAERTE